MYQSLISNCNLVHTFRGWPWSHRVWHIFHLSCHNSVFRQRFTCSWKYILASRCSYFTGLAFHIPTLDKPNKLQGDPFISSWSILYICALASGWYTSGNVWLLSPLRWFLALNQGVPLSDSNFWMDFTVSSSDY